MRADGADGRSRAIVVFLPAGRGDGAAAGLCAGAKAAHVVVAAAGGKRAEDEEAHLRQGRWEKLARSQSLLTRFVWFADT